MPGCEKVLPGLSQHRTEVAKLVLCKILTFFCTTLYTIGFTHSHSGRTETAGVHLKVMEVVVV